MKLDKIPKLKLKKGQWFTVKFLIRNRTVLNDGSYIGESILCLRNDNNLVTGMFVEGIWKDSTINFYHGVEFILRRIYRPILKKEKERMYKLCKSIGVDYSKVV